MSRPDQVTADVRVRFMVWLTAEVKKAGGQRAFARTVGVDHTTITRMLKGREPKLSMAVRLGYVE